MSRKRRLDRESPSVSEVIEVAKEPSVGLRLRAKRVKSRRASESASLAAQEQNQGKVMLAGLMDIEERITRLEKDEIEEESRIVVGIMQSPLAIQNGFVRSKAAAVLATLLCSPQCAGAVVDQGVEELLMQLKRDGRCSMHTLSQVGLVEFC